MIVNHDKPASEPAQHHFLVTGQIVFSPVPSNNEASDEGEMLHTVNVNCVVMSPDGRLAVAQIARAQQALQMQFFRRIEPGTVQVRDVVILALMPLGIFTSEEFNAMPEGMQLAPANDQPSAPSADPRLEAEVERVLQGTHRPN